MLRLSLLTTLLLAAGCSNLPAKDSNPAPAETTPAVVTPQPSDKRPPLTAEGTVAGAALANPAATNLKDDSGDQLADSRLYTDLWDRIRSGYALPPLENSLIARNERWFANNPEYIESMVGRARLYLYYIVEEVEKRGMPMEIALLPAIESAYKPQAYSRARAVGLWQFIQSTGHVYGLRSNWWYDGRRDVIASTRAALDYLEKLHGQFGDWQLALAAYNCGEHRVERLQRDNARRGLGTDFNSLTKLPRETKNYVPRLVAFANIIQDPAKYGLQLASIPNSEYFARVETDGQIDLGVVARLTDMPVHELFMINPGYSRWITDPEGPHELLIPAEKKDVLLEGLSKLSGEERVQWARHQVKRGDTMSRIAGHYQVTVEAIRTANDLPNNRLAAGQDLLIPVSANKLTAPPAIVKSASASRAGDGERVKVVHRVRSGESLWSIARKYRVYIHQLREWNLLESDDMLRMGQRLFIWTTRSSGASAASSGLFPG